MIKHCSGCGHEKPITDFYKKANRYDKSIGGYSHECKPCTREARAEYVKSNPDKCKNSDRAYRLNKYGISVSQYNDLFASQAGSCLGCGKHQSELSKRLCVDHDHSTGAIRGLLCPSCNVILGHAKDSPTTLTNLINYLTKPELAVTTNVVSITAGSKKAG